MLLCFRLLWFWCWFVTSAWASDAVCVTQHCVIVIDAGSTGSRAHLFAYDLDATHTPYHIQSLSSKRISPGLATLVTNQTAVDEYLESLLTALPANVPVYFYATGGMRTLSESRQQAYYQLIETWFNKKSRPLLALKTISGLEEGVFAWLAVAYESGRLEQKTWKDLGVIDTGGASVQIVVPYDKNRASFTENSLRFNLYGQSIDLFSYSVLGLGNTFVTNEFLTDEACFPVNYQLPNERLGQGDVITCTAHIAQWINARFALQEVVVPLIQQANIQWTVLGGLAYLPVSLQLSPGLIDMDILAEQAQANVCSAQWSDLVARNGGDSAAFDCLKAAYYQALWVSGYGLDKHALFDPSLGQTGIDWALGAVLLHPN